jgi:acid phosphatase type 7
VLGDNVYEHGTSEEHANCYDPAWGRHKARTRPAVGNHEYGTPDAAGYFGYFGAAAGDPATGYYSYELGDWHVVVLNSNCAYISCAAGSTQEQWLRRDLATNTKKCTLAYFHHPRFNSGASHGSSESVAPFWDALYEFGAEVILNGHEHLYERFAPQTPGAVNDPRNGIRQFTVGTGGRQFYEIGAILPNSEVRNNDTFGVLLLRLNADSYDWQFVPIAGQTFSDTGTTRCH